MKKTVLAFALPGLLLGAATALPTTAAGAQTYDPADEVIVIQGRWRDRAPADADSASQSVSYADLDLTNPWDRRELRRRVSLTARYLCDRLDEPRSGSALPATDCRTEATRDALARVGTIEQGWAPRGTAWVRPARWQAPYSESYASRYDDYDR